MGCFSYLCKECGKGVNSDSFTGEDCLIFFLEQGVITQAMQGQYDSYGRVFDEKNKSREWKGDWGDLVSMHFNDDITTGFAIVHQRCFKTLPKTRSENDPDQGWNYYPGARDYGMQAGDGWGFE